MQTLKKAFALSAAAVALAACTDRPEPAPTGPTSPRGANLFVTVPQGDLQPLDCDFTLLKEDARKYAKGGDALFTIINDLQNAKRRTTGPAIAAADDKMFDGLARMAAIRGTSAQETATADQPAAFDRLVKRFLGCAGTPAIWETAQDQDFSAALGPEFMFEVRGKNSDPIGTYDDPSGVAYEKGASSEGGWWAVENRTAPWASSITASGVPARVLIYGYRTGFFGDPQGELADAFETRTIPRIRSNVFALRVKVGLCITFDDPANSPITATQRLNHNGTFLPNVSMTCGESAPSYSVAAASNPLSSFAQYALSLFTPQPAHAAAMFFGGSIGAAPSELSPSAIYDLDYARISYNGDVLNTRIGQPLLVAANTPLAVKVESPDQKPLRDVWIRLEIVGNQSSISYFRDGNQNTVSVLRKSDPITGIATFDNVSVTKAGGFQLSAKVDVEGVVGTAILTNTFNVQNKK